MDGLLWKLSPENDNSSLTDYDKDNCFYQEMSFIWMYIAFKTI